MFDLEKLIAKNRLRHDYKKLILQHGLDAFKASGGREEELVSQVRESSLADLLELSEDLAVRLVVRTPSDQPEQRVMEYYLVHEDTPNDEGQLLQIVRSGKEFSPVL